MPLIIFGGVTVNKGVKNVVKGAMTGITVGTAAYMMMQSKAKKSGKKVKRKAAKAMKTMSDVFENISYMM